MFLPLLVALAFTLLPQSASATSQLPIALVHVADCESGDGTQGSARQFNDNGTVLRGTANRQDVGYFQINEHYHLKAAKRLGYDIYTEEGNISYALYLYQTSGLSPWSASKGCWGGSQAPPSQRLAANE